MNARIVNIDVSDLYRTRGRTGIQRVVREVTSRLLAAQDAELRVRVLRFDPVGHHYLELEREGVRGFLERDEEPPVGAELGFDDFGERDVFLDLDSAWNSPLKRPALYARLKARGVTIVTLVHDVLPFRFPELVHATTLRNWALFISAVYAWSDLVLFVSRSAERDFHEHRLDVGSSRDIPTVVVGNGADFSPSGEPDPAERARTDPFRADEYLLFVGTIEPRKLHGTAIEAMGLIHSVRPDVHLVFAGRQGWHSEDTVRRLRADPLFGQRIHWIEGPSDALLDELYRGAAATLYLSRGEGYGLPVAESLARGTVAIVSDNTALFEVGRGFADYVHFSSAREVAETALAYLNTPGLRAARAAQIARGFRPRRWDTVARTIERIVRGFATADRIAARPVPATVQWVFISNLPESLAATIASIDEHVSWVSEYLVVAPRALAASIAAIGSDRPIRVLAEEDLLGEDHAEFARAGHTRKNWMLRSRLAEFPGLDEEFIMLDDDNRPIAGVPESIFFGESSRYLAYWFFELERWPHRKTEFDFAQHATRAVLAELGAETLAYASHQPQVVNRDLWREAVALALVEEPEPGLDEWSVYFNLLATRYPSLVAKRPFRTLAWPQGPWSWERLVEPEGPEFENHYAESYLPGNVAGLEAGLTAAGKIVRAEADALPYRESASRYRESLPIIEALGLAHGAMVFEAGQTRLVVSGVPHLITVDASAPLRLSLTFALLREETAPAADVQFCYRVLGPHFSYGLALDHDGMPRSESGHGVLSLDVPGEPLAPGVYDLQFFARIGGENVFPERVSYRSRLVVCAPGESILEAYARL